MQAHMRRAQARRQSMPFGRSLGPQRDARSRMSPRAAAPSNRSSERVAGLRDVPKRQRENPKVEPDRPMLDVIQVVLYPLDQVAVAAQVVDLSPARDTGLHQMLLHVAGDALAETGDKFRALRSRPDERHASAENVDELRQLVQA